MRRGVASQNITKTISQDVKTGTARLCSSQGLIELTAKTSKTPRRLGSLEKRRIRTKIDTDNQQGVGGKNACDTIWLAFGSPPVRPPGVCFLRTFAFAVSGGALGDHALPLGVFAFEFVAGGVVGGAGADWLQGGGGGAAGFVGQ